MEAGKKWDGPSGRARRGLLYNDVLLDRHQSPAQERRRHVPLTRDPRMVTTSDLETMTQRYGREIFARIDRGGPVPFTPAWWDDRLMEWSMGDEAIKVQLFRFVDVLPLLRTPADIARHLREYFGQAQGRLPGWLTLGLNLIPSDGVLGKAFAAVAHRSARRLAR